MCEKGFDLSLIEQLINLSKFEEQVRKKLNEEFTRFGKTLKGNFYKYYKYLKHMPTLNSDGAELPVEHWNEEVITLTKMMDEYNNCEEIIQYNIAKIKLKIDHLLR